MSGGITVLIIVLAILVIAAAVALARVAWRRQLQQRFGPEYDRAVSQQDSQIRVEAELTQRQRRVRRLNIKPLPDSARRQYRIEWQEIQEQFVDSPESAVNDAYALVTTVMHERGYPIDDDEQVMADLSVDHARTVGNFRSAQAITRDAAHGSAATEDMRRALINYRELFADLLGEPANANGARHASPAETPVSYGQPDTQDGRGQRMRGYQPDPAAGESDDASATYPDSEVERSSDEGTREIV
jgi:hypothetical protein